MTILAIVVALLVVAAAVILIVAATKPDMFNIQRSASINAPPEKIFPLVSDLHSHSAWNPFDKDQSLKRDYSGAPNGKGAVYAWEGNRKSGTGRIEIIDAAPSSKLTMKLDMFAPFKAHNTVDFTFDPKGGSTNVTWAMRGLQPYMAKIMSTFINCDKMVGGQFEVGLANLKAIVEK
jgi:uncharacterized protein YndB with AHSA1/START domain